MENQKTEQENAPEIRQNVDPKEKNYRFTMIVMSLVLLALVLFSGFQTLYIFRMNTGLEGIMSYTKIFKSDNYDDYQETGAIEQITDKMNPQELPEPWFSLEEASSVNKQKMATVDIVKKVSPATVPLSIIGIDDGQETKIGSGTGFIITKDGYIVTNQHVVIMSDRAVNTYYVTVLLPDVETPVKAEIVGSDVQTDIAVLKVETDKELPCVTFGDSDKLQAGELAIVIGNSLGKFDDSVTVGVISAPLRQINRHGYFVDIIQTDAAINPGNSGGPLINSFGEVVGITNAKIVTGTSENLGFAIPVNSVKKVIESIINYGKVVGRPYLGVSLQQVADNAYFGAKGGVFVAEIVRGGPADQAGFELGDRVVLFDGVEIKESGDIIRVRDSHKVGDTVEFVVERDGQEIKLSLVIGDSADQ